ncbi:MAG: nitroreductase, partial [Candidatus Aminicenantes bacterium]|nr:nitroreductase [Candidatus Aminicenantes bacterium]
LEGWPLKALEAARLAPSATNRQPWRFEVGDGSITVRIDGGREGGRFSKRLDCGIAMLHLELGARAAGVDGRWVFLPAPAVARFERK